MRPWRVGDHLLDDSDGYYLEFVIVAIGPGDWGPNTVTVKLIMKDGHLDEDSFDYPYGSKLLGRLVQDPIDDLIDAVYDNQSVPNRR